MTGPTSTPLESLDPKWIHQDVPMRVGVGIEFNCPRCHRVMVHRLFLFFIEPIDAGPPERLPVLYGRSGMGYKDLTLWTARPRMDPLIVHGHWRGFVDDGCVWDAVPRSLF